MNNKDEKVSIQSMFAFFVVFAEKEMFGWCKVKPIIIQVKLLC